MMKAMRSRLNQIFAGAVSAQLLITVFMQAASAQEHYYDRLAAHNRAVAHAEAVAYNRAAVYNQAVANANYNRAVAYNRAAAWNNYNRAAAYNRAVAMSGYGPVPVASPYGFNPYYRPSVFTTHPILSGTLLGGGIGALGGAALGALTTDKGETSSRGQNIAVGTGVGAGTGAVIGMGVGLLRNKAIYGYY
jgi:hypothetical protein